MDNSISLTYNFLPQQHFPLVRTLFLMRAGGRAHEQRSGERKVGTSAGVGTRRKLGSGMHDAAAVVPSGERADATAPPPPSTMQPEGDQLAGSGCNNIASCVPCEYKCAGAVAVVGASAAALLAWRRCS